jgi:hypothetical protein
VVFFILLHFERLTALFAIRLEVNESGLDYERDATFDGLELLLYWSVLSETRLVKLGFIIGACKASKSGVELASCLLLALDYHTWRFIHNYWNIHFLDKPRAIDSPPVFDLLDRVWYNAESIRSFSDARLFKLFAKLLRKCVLLEPRKRFESFLGLIEDLTCSIIRTDRLSFDFKDICRPLL